MDIIWKCIHHSRSTDIYCKGCKKYICPECLTTHSSDGHKQDLVHIFDYSSQVAVPILDHLLKDINRNDSELNLNAIEFVATLNNFVPLLRDSIIEHEERIVLLKSLTAQIESFIGPLKQGSYTDRIRSGLIVDKMKLEQALREKDLKTVVTITKKIEAEKEISGGEERDKAIISRIKSSLEPLKDLNIYKDLLDSVQKLSFKCQHMRLNMCVTGWKLDKKYLTRKMTLTEDGLTYGNQAGNGYPAIIGDTPVDYGVIAYEVHASGLCCSGKEGFGMIDYKKYKEKYAADEITPTAYSEMLGLFYNNVATNMTVVSGSSFTNNEKYTVVANLITLTMIIKGPNCHLRADLLPDVFYVPCFSSGCRGNKIVVTPIEVYNDD